jgi:2-iminobutanoate/2-iminopropanoate deaminase
MKEIINTPNAPSPVGPYNQAIMAGNTLYISGQIAIDPASGDIINESIELETHQVLKNISAILEEADMNLEHVIKCSVFVSNMEDFGKINGVYAQYFRESTAPARELVEVRNLPKYVNIEISAIALKST